MKLFKKIKQLFCKHEFVFSSEYDENTISKYHNLECTKCKYVSHLLKQPNDIAQHDLNDNHSEYHREPKLAVEYVNELMKKSKDVVSLERDSELLNISKTKEKIDRISNTYDINKNKFKNAEYDEIELVLVREYLRGERYLNIDNLKTEKEENKYLYEIGHNRAIDKLINFIDELTNNKFKYVSNYGEE